MAQPFTVTAGTSIVLISTLQSPNTVVLLSSIQYPGHIVGIRDITGSNEIAQTPVVISTMSSLKFYDGTSSIVLNTPNGFVSLSSRDSRTWQLLNSVGFLTTLSTGFLETLTSDRAFVTTTSTIQEFTSSLVAANVTVTKSIEVLGNTNIEGNISIAGSFDVFSTLRAYQNVSLSSGLIVAGDVSFPSSLFIKDNVSVGSNLSTSQNLLVGQDLWIHQNLYGRGILLPSLLSVQTLTVDTLIVGGGVQLAGGLSTVNMSVLSNVLVAGKGTFENSLFVSGMTAVQSTLFVDSELTTSSFQVANAAATFAGDIRVSTLAVFGGLSTLESLSATNHGTFQAETLVYGGVTVKNTTVVENLTVISSVYMSSLVVSSFLTNGFVSSYGSTLVVESGLTGLSTFAIGGDLIAGGRGSPYTYSFFSTGLDVGILNIEDSLTIGKRLNVKGDSFIGGNMDGITSITALQNISTGSLDVGGSVTILGNLDVNQVASASTLGAPIRFDISTLSLSNVMTVNSFASIPSFTVNQVPAKLAAGQSLANRGGNDIFVDGVLQNRSSVFQVGDPMKLWYANLLRTSTLSGLPNLSSVVLGNANFTYPIGTPYRGIVAGGQLAGGANIISFASNVTSAFNPSEGAFLAGFLPKRIRYNGSNLWVAVGLGGTGFAYSQNGYSWFPGMGLSMSGVNDVVYGGGKWVATGVNPGGPTIAYSVNGISWSAGSNTFATPGFGNGVAYNGTNQWVAVGRSPSGLAQAKFSSDGISWQNSVLALLYGETQFTCVLWDNANWNAFTNFTTGNSWVYQSGNGINFNLFAGVQQAVLYAAYGGTDPDFSGSSYVLVGSNLGGGFTTTVSRGAFLPARNFIGIFTLEATDVVYDSITSNWLVAGFNMSELGPSFGYTSNLTSLSMGFTFPGSNRTIAPGTLQTPQFDQYFTANLTSIFRSTLSSQQMTVSTLNVSSVQGTFFGDGSRLTNISQYTSTLFVSSITAREMRTQDISASLALFQTTRVNDFVNVPFKTFPSSGNLFLAAGNDNTARGSIQTSPDGTTWARSLTSNFEFYGNDIVGNGDLQNPLYVAVGADSRPKHTIQYSRDGILWNPVLTGGFDYATEEGVCEATSVAYGLTNTNIPMWVATGVYIGSTATTQYSLDGLNWSNLDNGFEDFGTKVKGSPYAPPNSGFLASGKNAMKYILSPPTWNDITITLFGSPTVTNMTAFAPGRLSGNIDSWLAVDEQNRLYVTPSKIPAIFSGGAATTVGPVNDLIWRGNTDWTAVGSNIVQTSDGGFTWTQQLQFNEFVTSLNSIAFNSTLVTYVLGATSVLPSFTLWNSPNGTTTWNQIVSGGFSTAVENYGQGYGIVSLGTSTFAVGNSALTLETRVRPAILKLFSTANSSLVTEISLTASNASNLFTSVVRGIGATDSEVYKYVAVGDAPIPQKTIARSIDGSQGSWIPAITGGFNDTGYGVTYFRDNWIAVGNALSSRNTIQYSPDGANWFGTNNASGIRLGGRAIAAGISTLSSVVVAVGNDSGIYNLVFSRDGFNWSTTTGCNFNVQGNGVACGLGDTVNNPSTMFIAVGQDTRGSSNTILRSLNGVDWFLTGAGGGLFSDGGYGIAFGNNTWVAVGQDSNENTILYSTDGGTFWNNAANGFNFAGYGVTYSEGFSSFFAVGKDINGDSPLTVKYSENGASWTNFSTTTGFISQKAVGSANGVMTQGIFSFESVPYMNFSNLVVYDRESPLLYPFPSIRVSTNYIAFSEGMYVNLSSQVSFGSNSNYPGAAVTVSPYPVFVSSILYYGSTFVSSIAQFSTVTVSSIQTNNDTLLTCPFETPAFAFNVPSTAGTTPSFSEDVFPRYELGRANFMTPEIPQTVEPVYTFHVNTTLQINAIRESIVSPNILRNNVVIGKQSSDTNYSVANSQFPEMLVYGNVGASTFSTNVLYAPCNVYVSASRVYFRDEYLSIFEGLNPSLIEEGNRIQTEPSSMTFNSLLTLQVSTQKVGVYTRDPHFELDVQRDAVLSGIEAKELNTSLLFLTIQTLNN
jgi:hypothetical protein